MLRQRKESLLLLWHQQFQCQRGFGLSVYRDDSTLRGSAYKNEWVGVFIKVYIHMVRAPYEKKMD